MYDQKREVTEALAPWQITFTFIHLADAFIQSDFQERALQSA